MDNTVAAESILTNTIYRK